MEGRDVVKSEPPAQDRMDPPPPEVSITEANFRTSGSHDSGRGPESLNLPAQSRTTPHQHHPYHQQYPSPHDVWSGAISRLQTQSVYNTSMVEAQRKDVVRVEYAVGKLQQEMSNVMAVLNDIRTELDARPPRPQSGETVARRDVGDFDVIAEQLENVSRKASEVEGLKMQVELMRQRMRRLEGQGSPSAGSRAMETATSSNRGPSVHGQGPPMQHGQQHSQTQHHQHRPLPPMRTSSMNSPAESRHPGCQHASVHEPQQGLTTFVHPTPSSERSSGHASISSAYARPNEPLPPPSAITGWRSSQGQAQTQSMPPPRPAPAHGAQPESQASGWASVNASQAHKRPFEDRPTQPEASPGSPKRARLAPIMPRSGYNDENYGPSQSPYHSIPTTAASVSDSSYLPRSYSGESSLQGTNPSLPTQDTSAQTTSLRYVPSTAALGVQGSWRPESDSSNPLETRPTSGPGSRGGRIRARGVGRARGNRGGRGRGRGQSLETTGSTNEDPTARLGTPEWERPGWAGSASHVSPNGYYNHPNPYSPSATRPSHSAHEPMDLPPSTPFNPASASGSVGGESSENKKSRTKPTRNAEGVLLRKDGRPDMRAVSSANNLRKVHAKKEAERALETESGRARSVSESGTTGEGSGGHIRSSAAKSEGGATPEREHVAADDDDAEAQRHMHDELLRSVFPRKATQGLQQEYFPDPTASLLAQAAGREGEAEASRAESTYVSQAAAHSPPRQNQPQLHRPEDAPSAASTESSQAPSQIPAQPATAVAASPPTGGRGLRQGSSVSEGSETSVQQVSNEVGAMLVEERGKGRVWEEYAGERARAREREEYVRERARVARGGGNE